MVKQILKTSNLFLFIFSFYRATCFGGVFDSDTNYIDSNKLKQGLWKTCKSRLCSEAYYLNDTLNGVFKSYYQNKNISSFGLYRKGKMIGNWYYFDEKGYLYMEVSKIYNKTYIKQNGTNSIKFSNKAYVKIFYLNGICKEEGVALFDDVEIDIDKIGYWKYFDEKGKLKKTTKEEVE